MGLDVGNGMSCALDSKIGIEKSEPPSGQLRSGPGTGISLVRTWYTSSSAFCLLRAAASTSESQVKSGRYIPNFIEQTAQCDQSILGLPTGHGHATPLISSTVCALPGTWECMGRGLPTEGGGGCS